MSIVRDFFYYIRHLLRLQRRNSRISVWILWFNVSKNNFPLFSFAFLFAPFSLQPNSSHKVNSHEKERRRAAANCNLKYSQMNNLSLFSSLASFPPYRSQILLVHTRALLVWGWAENYLSLLTLFRLSSAFILICNFYKRPLSEKGCAVCGCMWGEWVEHGSLKIGFAELYGFPDLSSHAVRSCLPDDLTSDQTIWQGSRAAFEVLHRKLKVSKLSYSMVDFEIESCSLTGWCNLVYNSQKVIKFNASAGFHLTNGSWFIQLTSCTYEFFGYSRAFESKLKQLMTAVGRSICFEISLPNYANMDWLSRAS